MAAHGTRAAYTTDGCRCDDCREANHAYHRRRTHNLPTKDLTAPRFPRETGDGAWRDSALCAQADPELWFPSSGDNPWTAQVTCRACPVRTDCLADAMRTGVEHGIWGGLTPAQRQALAQGRTYADPVREWAITNGYTVTGHGRVPAAVREAYERAHGEAPPCPTCEDTRHLSRAGVPLAVIAERLGYARASLIDHLRRHGEAAS